MADDIRVIQNADAKRFEVEGAGDDAVLNYHLGTRHITLIHTEVSPKYEGKGYAGALVRAALNFARAGNLRVIPHCPFVRTYIARHPEFADLVKAE